MQLVQAARPGDENHTAFQRQVFLGHDFLPFTSLNTLSGTLALQGDDGEGAPATKKGGVSASLS